MAESGIPIQETRQLPGNKSYHFYFLYKVMSPDKDIAENLSSKLAKRGYQCCSYGKDSLQGKLIIDNFWRLLHKSMRVVILFSKAFVTSCWSKYEVDVILSFSMEGKVGIIPLIIDDCEIPEAIGSFMEYLDISGPEENWLARFYAAAEKDMDDLCRKFDEMLLNESHLCGIEQRDEDGPWESFKLPSIRYDTRRYCNKLDYPRICRNFIIHDACTNENCELSHDIKNDQSKPLLQQMGFDFSNPDELLVYAYRKGCIEMLKKLPYSRVTGPCTYYNNSGRDCLDSFNGQLCPFPHICIRWFQGKCNFTQESCPFAHDFSNENTQKLLELFKIDISQSDDEILRSYRAKYGGQQQ